MQKKQTPKFYPLNTLEVFFFIPCNKGSVGDGHEGLGTLFLTVLQGQTDGGCAMLNAWLLRAT